MGAIGLYFSNLAPISSPGLLIKPLKPIQTDKNLDRYIDRLLADSWPIYRTAIFWLTTKCRLTIDRVSTNYWPIHRSSIDQLSAKCRWTKSYIGRDTSGTTIDRVSTEYRPTSECYIDQVSTDCRRTVDWLSTDCRPLYRPISWSTLPIVNKILEKCKYYFLPLLVKFMRTRNSLPTLVNRRASESSMLVLCRSLFTGERLAQQHHQIH